MKLTQSVLDKIVGKNASKVKGMVINIRSTEEEESITSSVGNILTDDPFYIASINKFFISALTLKIVASGDIRFSHKVGDFFSPEWIRNLIVINGLDQSANISVRHLLSHTSGLPCYLIDKGPDGEKIMDQLQANKDQEWPFEKVIERVRGMKGKFVPGSEGKAAYSNTNFRILGRILEIVSQKPLPDLLHEMFLETGMLKSAVLTGKNQKRYVPVNHKNTILNLPQYFASSQMDVVSTAADLSLFIKAFFEGRFYPKKKLHELEEWNRIFFPFKYGIGLQQFYTPRIFSPFKPIPHMIGHAGSVGSVAFYVPARKIFITGTINQTKRQPIIFSTMVRILNAL